MLSTLKGCGALGALLAAACATTAAPGPRMLAPTGCRSSGLWVLERHDQDALPSYWVTIAMAPWESWTTGFLLADGRGASLSVRMSEADGGRLAITARQDDLDREPTVFARSSVGPCTFYAAGQSETYRFRRER